MTLAGQLDTIHWGVLALGLAAMLLLLLGERWLPGRPVGLAVVILSIIAATALGPSAFGRLMCATTSSTVQCIGWVWLPSQSAA